MNMIRRATERLLWLASSVGVVASLAGLLVFISPFWELANHFRPFIVIGAVCLLALSLWAGVKASIKVAIILIAFNALLLLPALSNRAVFIQSTQPALSQQLQIITFNMWGQNKNIPSVLSLIEDEDADIVLLQEFFSFHAAKMVPFLRKKYPYIYHCSGERSCNIAIASKKKWSAINHVGWTKHHAPLIDATFQNSDKGGKDFHVMVTHTAWPFHPYKQKKDMDWLANYVKKTKSPVILAGDLNLSPWSWKMYRFQSKTGLKRHTTLMHSWPAHQLMPFVQLDHVLASPEIKSYSVRIGKNAGSDHLPVIATLVMP